ncbi:MAG: histidine kinase [Candidatus Aminicenantes bacterium RBG_13_62_12]|nr:MAG: histidine kinase [Candidatus Aminicenantes bacterium RBG_13_62_12]
MSGIKILIVEDEAIVAKDMESMLRSMGYEVSGVASTGAAALRLAEEAHPDLVLMDIVLQGDMDGIEAAAKIWQSLGIPVIYITAYADKNTLGRAKVTEPFGYIIKPFNERDLQTVIEMAYYKSRMDLQLREREAWLRTILWSIGDGVIAADEQDRVTFMNPLAETLTGWDIDSARFKPLREIFRVRHSRTSVFEDLFQQDETVLLSRDGGELPVETTETPLDKGRVIVFRDISERVRADREIREGWARLRQALEGTIQAFAMTIEIRDPHTAGHQRRVAQLAEAIGREMGLNDEATQGLRVMGNIHDIGKIFVPVEILNKPGKISSLDYTIIQSHPQAGYDILKNIHFPWPVAKAVLQHHERLNGSGYPAGLCGEDIMLEARILSVADVVEAISANRPYRFNGELELAFREIMDNRGVLYDSRAVDACLRVFKEKNFRLD